MKRIYTTPRHNWQSKLNNIVSQQATPSSVYSNSKYAAGASNFSSARATSVASSRGGMASAGHSSSGGG